MKRREFLLATAGAMVAGNSFGMFPQPTNGNHSMNSDLFAGVAVRSIVPDPQLVNNAVHGNMTVRFDERGSELRVKGLALASGESKRLLVAADSVGVSPVHAVLIRQAIAEATGVADEDIVISASHSHSTPK